MLVKSQIVVLHTIKHGDTGIVVQCYSNTSGRCSLYFRASRKSSNISLLHKLNILDVVTYSNGTQSMPTIKEAVAPYNLGSLRSDIYKSSIAIFISELLGRTVRESEANPHLYSFISSSIQILEHIDEGVANFHIHFLTHLCKMLGFMPMDNYSTATPLFDMATAKFTAHPFGNGIYGTQIIGERESQLLHALMNTPSTNLARPKCGNQELQINGELRLSYAKRMIEYISHHIGNTIEIKSLDILHQIFS
ncbi:MAG: DNA repair protein RecO [Bacteroidales bacterium]|nr:DNA repair protein RecO [Bacteroidales bacterium]MBQ8646343.1 DNA repair protein RecO [Bacteroidales bacterium]MBR4088677.1 DNA repair protein RecO [Bacteroidales bacterium]